ncbi:hypothetical protein ATL40_1436 [Serinibacter salmoneus]|uniref:Phospholipase D-like protein n=2 Tax=Serinibacter salmoneus TaxID=556530 RepID=A0A2A9D1Y0_9MICO|nr:hypothetical protein ATL40_1436 [Serinibacter salmoneus]
MDVVGLTFGQFSLLDLIEAGLEVTGPADVTISTWSAGFYDVEAAQRFAQLGAIRSIRFVMDSSAKRGQATPVDVAGLFGAESIRVFRTHAKFALLRNESWDVVITTSMNLNLNPRCEQFEMTDDTDRADLFSGFVDELFRELPEGATGDRTVPEHLAFPDVDPQRSYRVGGRVATGPWRRGAPRE